MTGQFTSGRSAASSLSTSLMSGLALLFLTAAPAPAQDQDDGWILLTSDENADVHVERDSLMRNGSTVLSWISYTPRKRDKSPEKRRRYDYQLLGRIDDCAAGAYTTEVVVYRRYDGEDVETRRAADTDLQFAPNVPGSVGEHVSTQLCALAANAATFEPAVPIDEAAPGDWQLVGASEARGVRVSALPSWASRTRETAAIVARTDYAATKTAPDGRGYRSVVEMVVFYCDTGEFALASTDLYNAAGTLVGTAIRPAETAQIRQRKPGDAIDQIGDLACSAPPAPQTGTGWLAGRGYIVTASHVVGELGEVEIFQDGRRLGAAQVVRNDPANDVAVLKPLFDTSRHSALRVSAAAPALGARVFTLGYPLADELGVGAVKMTAGDVSSLAGVDVTTGRADDHRYLQVSIPVQSGNSGGPVIAPDGSVVGLIVAKQQTSADLEIVQNVNFALKSAYISGMIDGLPPIGRVRVSAVRGDTAAIVAGVQSGVFLIVAAPKPEQTAEK